MQDAWRAYLELALGLTEASRRKAQEVAKDLIGRGEATASQVQSFVDETLSTSRANREGLVRLVRYEVDRALGAVGLATAEEVAALTGRLRELERRLNEVSSGGPAPAATPSAGADQPTQQPVAQSAVTGPAGTRQVVKKSVARKSVARKSVATQNASAKTTATKAAKKQPAAKQPAAEQSATSKRAVPKSAG